MTAQWGYPVRCPTLVVVFALMAPRAGSAQSPIDSTLLAYIDGIRAVDALPHPMRPVPAGGGADTDFDALPLDGIPPFGERRALLAKPNIYADISMMDVILPAAQLAGVLRQWLGEWPDALAAYDLDAR